MNWQEIAEKSQAIAERATERWGEALRWADRCFFMGMAAGACLAIFILTVVASLS